MSDDALANTPANKKTCPVSGYEACWVKFKTSGYPRKLRREWDSANTADTVTAIILRYVTEWHVLDVDGQAVELTREASCLDNVEEAVAAWLVRIFQDYWLKELPAPTKN